jgi:nucleotide-binding universal stress UspA family protein
MYRMVVVPLDGSSTAEAAIPPARALARAVGAELELLRIVEPNEAAEVAEAHAYLEAIAASITSVGVRPPMVIEADRPAECIANAGEAEDTLVCLSSHGGSGVRRALLGSVAEDVLRLLGRPLLIVGPEVRFGESFDGLALVCSDGSGAADAVLPVAERWCRELGLTPWFLSVIDPAAVPVGSVVSDPPSDTVEWAHVEQLARRWSEAGLEPGWDVVVERKPVEAIVDRAASQPTALVALATHGRTGLARLALGSVAAGVIRNAPCPVLVTRPSDLVEDD